MSCQTHHPRRMRLTVLLALPCAAALSAPAGPRVTVLGGSGFVGSRVCAELVARGASVTSVSRSGRPPAWCASAPWAGSVTWTANEFTRGPREELEKALAEPEVVVSTVGAVGFDVQGLRLGNGVANAEAARAARRSSPALRRYVFVGVASEVAACEEGWLPPFFSGYFDGKRMAEDAVADAAGGAANACMVRPSFIYGGDSFGLFPPRVSAAYGAAVEQALSLAPVQKLAELLPGLLKVRARSAFFPRRGPETPRYRRPQVALRPPVCVDAVARACAIAALAEPGAVAPVVDGTAAINALAEQPPARGISDLFGSSD